MYIHRLIPVGGYVKFSCVRRVPPVEGDCYRFRADKQTFVDLVSDLPRKRYERC